MAEKGFGVKEVNLIGASGTPTITSPNNLNLNAVNVAISTNVSIGGTLSVTGNVSVGGTLTYEDVTNIDSVGLITARSGLIVSGVTTFSNDVDFKGSGGSTKILFDASQDQLEFADSSTITFGNHSTTGDYSISYVNGTEFGILAMSGGSQDLVIGSYASGVTTKNLVSVRSTGAIESYYGGSKKLETTNTGVNVTGAITVNGSALSITPTDSDIQVVYTVTANGASAYRFAGNGVVSTADNPDLYLIRGKKYRFINNSGGSHPFQIRESSGGTAYSTGVTNNGAASGNIDFAPTFDSPAQLVYQCTSHGGMVGNIYLRGAAGNENNVGVVTASSFESTTFSKTPTNTPAFHAYKSGSNSPALSQSTWTKVTILTDETLDTDSAYDGSKFTVPSGKGGYYQVAASINLYADNNDMKNARIAIYKNGSVAIQSYNLINNYASGIRHYSVSQSGVLNLSASDYIEVYVNITTNGGSASYLSNDANGVRGSFFSAFKLII